MSGETAEPASTSPLVSVLIVTWNAREEIGRCLAALQENTRLPFEAIIVDNASDDGTTAAARAALPEARVLENSRNEGFARANNSGLREARAPYVLILNPDAELRPGALDVLARHLDTHPQVGAVGPRTRNEDGTIQVSFGPDLSLASEWSQRRLVRGVKARHGAALAEAELLASRASEPDWISGACLLARREALQALGGFDEGFFLYEEDADLCRRLRAAGWRVAFTPEAEVLHRLGRSMTRAPRRARAEYHRSHIYYYRKHNGPVATLGLRALIAASAVARLLSALGTSASAKARRDEARMALRIALRGA